MIHSKTVSEVSPTRQAFLFDLDGTLVDSVYQHLMKLGVRSAE